MLNRELFQRLQTLSRLRLPPQEEDLLFQQVGRILEFVRQLEPSECLADAPRNAPPPPPMREDLPAGGLTYEEAFAGSASASGGLFRVPPVLPREAL